VLCAASQGLRQLRVAQASFPPACAATLPLHGPPLACASAQLLPHWLSRWPASNATASNAAPGQH